MSDSDASITIPADAKIKAAFRKTITRIYKAGDLEKLTRKRVRSDVETQLDLPEDWFKGHSDWDAKSKDLIAAEVKRLVAESEEDVPVVKTKAAKSAAVMKRKKPDGGDAKKRKPMSPKPRKKRKVSIEEDDHMSVDEKMSSAGEEKAPEPAAKSPAKPKAVQKPRTKAKKILDSDDEDEGGEQEGSDIEEEASKPVAKKIAKAKAAPKLKSKLKKTIASDDEEDEEMKEAAESSASEQDLPKSASKKRTAVSKAAPKTKVKEVVDLDDEDDEMKGDKRTALPKITGKDVDGSEPETKPPKMDGNESSSSMSSLLDEPPKKQRQKKSLSTNAPKKATSKPAKPKKAPKESSPDDEEIKRLQGWLIKCGIRKVWGAYLKEYETPKAKISHLKSMLTDVGMTGRYSAEKASSVKEMRELAADVEAAQAFETKWGTKDEETARPKRQTMAQSMGLDESLIDSGSDED